MMMNADLIDLMFATPGHDVVHVRYINHLRAWQASTYWSSLAGTVLFERAACPPRRSRKLAVADARATALPIK
jgi:hypothetical protein